MVSGTVMIDFFLEALNFLFGHISVFAVLSSVNNTRNKIFQLFRVVHEEIKICCMKTHGICQNER
jgi:hypothetical protein